MEKIVGHVTSKTSGKSYPVKWNSEEKYAWIGKNLNTWELACEKVYSANDALACAQGFIDSQPELY